MSYIELKGITKRFTTNDKPALNNISIAIEKGNIVTLLGPSGCGKTTTLRIIAGFEKPDSGLLMMDNKIMTHEDIFIAPEDRGIGMVFQDYALFPHLTVQENIGFGIPKNRDWKKRIEEALEMVELSKFCKCYPNQLSGGQQQRVALARALTRNPVAVLLDEPFSNLDTDLRICMRQEVARIIKKSKATAIFVTHDQKEALSISDRIVVMKEGQVQQIGTSIEIYQRPKTRFVANFVGQSNIIEGIIGENNIVKTSIGEVFVDGDFKLPNRKVILSVRPEGFIPKEDGHIKGEVVYKEYGGSFNSIAVRVGQKHTLFIHLSSIYSFQVGQSIELDNIPFFTSIIQE